MTAATCSPADSCWGRQVLETRSKPLTPAFADNGTAILDSHREQRDKALSYDVEKDSWQLDDHVTDPVVADERHRLAWTPSFIMPVL